VHLVTHREAARDDVLERDAAAVRERGCKRGPERARSLIVQYARLPNVRFSTISTGWLVVVMPVIGPTAPK
jgi:hypothetical protein